MTKMPHTDQSVIDDLDNHALDQLEQSLIASGLITDDIGAERDVDRVYDNILHANQQPDARGASPSTAAPIHPTAGSTPSIHEVDEKSLIALLELSEPVLVIFSAHWCMPCQQLKASALEVVTHLNVPLHLVSINVDQSPDLANSMGIRGVPFTVVFHRGNALDQRNGAMSTSTMMRWLQELLS